MNWPSQPPIMVAGRSFTKNVVIITCMITTKTNDYYWRNNTVPSKYIKKGESPEGRERRLRAFRHNALTGHVRMMQMQLLAMCQSDTTTQEAKQIAYQIAELASKLEQSLKTRIDL